MSPQARQGCLLGAADALVQQMGGDPGSRLSAFHVPHSHCDAGWGQSLPHSALDLVEVFKDVPASIIG